MLFLTFIYCFFSISKLNNLSVNMELVKLIDSDYRALDLKYDSNIINLYNTVNYYIDNNKYDKAIHVLEKILNNLPKYSDIYKYTEIRQAILSIMLCNLAEYNILLNNKYKGFSEELKGSLLSLHSMFYIKQK
ncbi:hypothetical protein AB837_00024 [bacterium AB1]|nr:hypothetical protein AB837_00024 [bacterium AB1]